MPSEVQNAPLLIEQLAFVVDVFRQRFDVFDEAFMLPGEQYACSDSFRQLFTMQSKLPRSARDCLANSNELAEQIMLVLEALGTAFQVGFILTAERARKFLKLLAFGLSSELCRSQRLLNGNPFRRNFLHL